MNRRRAMKTLRSNPRPVHRNRGPKLLKALRLPLHLKWNRSRPNSVHLDSDDKGNEATREIEQQTETPYFVQVDQRFGIADDEAVRINRVHAAPLDIFAKERFRQCGPVRFKKQSQSFHPYDVDVRRPPTPAPAGRAVPESEASMAVVMCLLAFEVQRRRMTE